MKATLGRQCERPGKHPSFWQLVLHPMPNNGIAHILTNLPCLVCYRVVGESMLPTLSDGQYVLARPLPCEGEPVSRGDIVVLRNPTGARRVYVKRIIGLPDEYIRLDGGRVTINDVPLVEPYLADGRYSQRRHAGQWFTDRREFFVLGDNRGNSEDSLTFGLIRREQILGRVWCRCWPPWAWRRFSGAASPGRLS